MIDTMRFRRLSHSFAFNSNDVAIHRYVARLLERFAERDGSEGGPTYEVVDLGPKEQSRFHLMIDGSVVLAGATPAPILDELFSRLNRAAVDASQDRVVVHAGAVVTPEGDGIVLPAPSGSGKTTLVAGLVRAGFGYLSEEAAVFDPVAATLHPYPIHLSLKGESRAKFPDGAPDPADLEYSPTAWRVDPEAIRAGAVASSCDVRFVISHRYVPGADIRVESLTPAETCIHLAQNLMLGRRAARSSLELLASVCRRSQGFRVTHGDLDEAVQAIIDLTCSEGRSYLSAAYRASPGTLSAPMASSEAARPSSSNR